MNDELGEGYLEAREFAARAPPRARYGKISASTAGWTDPTLVKAGVFYPRSVKTSRDRLAHFASEFSFVEVDSTYYALLASAQMAAWVDATPSDFTFHVKAHPVLTGHLLDLARLPKDIALELGADAPPRIRQETIPRPLLEELERRFFESIAPLVEARRLETILLQFPPWFKATRGNVRTIEAIRERQPTLPFSVEFRSEDWFEAERKSRVLSMLSERNFDHVIVDEPLVPGSVPLVPEVTTKAVVIRMHGRNAGGWTKKGATVSERFNYLYSPEELRDVARKLVPVVEKAESVHVVMNNCVRDFAVIGARGMISAFSELLG